MMVPAQKFDHFRVDKKIPNFSFFSEREYFFDIFLIYFSIIPYEKLYMFTKLHQKYSIVRFLANPCHFVDPSK